MGATQKAISLLESLLSLHRLKIVHADVKPDNFAVMGEDDEVWLLFDVDTSGDDGSARPEGVMMTPLYAAPEVASGRSLRLHLSEDLFSFAVMLYEMLVGHHLLIDLKEEVEQTAEGWQREILRELLMGTRGRGLWTGGMVTFGGTDQCIRRAKRGCRRQCTSRRSSRRATRNCCLVFFRGILRSAGRRRTR